MSTRSIDPPREPINSAAEPTQLDFTNNGTALLFADHEPELYGRDGAWINAAFRQWLDHPCDPDAT